MAPHPSHRVRYGAAARSGRQRALAWLALLASVLALAFGPAVPALADTQAPQWRSFPFAQKLDLALVRKVVHSAPGELLASIAAAGVDVLVVRTAGAAKPVNPLLSALPAAPAALLQQADFRDSYEGKVVLRDSGCCTVARDTILVRDSAKTYTLLHEFVQSRLLPLHDPGGADAFELRFGSDFRRLTLYQQRLYDDVFRLLDPQWRRDIVDAQAAVAGGLFRRIQMGQSQEAIVEKLLCSEIGVHSAYFDPARQQQGQCYGEAMIDNAVDLYNAVNDSVVFVEDATRTLRAEIIAGRITPGPQRQLSDADVQAVAQATAAVRRTLLPVRDELAALKQFYAR